MASPDASLTGNRLLDLLPIPDRERLLPGLRRAEILTGEEMQANLRPISRVLFPITGMLSLMATLEDGPAMETATVGNGGHGGCHDRPRLSGRGRTGDRPDRKGRC
jgi:hypothetical protein